MVLNGCGDIKRYIIPCSYGDYGLEKTVSMVVAYSWLSNVF